MPLVEGRILTTTERQGDFFEEYFESIGKAATQSQEWSRKRTAGRAAQNHISRKAHSKLQGSNLGSNCRVE